MTRWCMERTEGEGLKERILMYEEIGGMIDRGELVLPEKKVFKLKDYKLALDEGKNAVFDCS